MRNEQKRITMLGDQVLRKQHPLLLAFSGASFAASSSISILGLQEFLLANLSGALDRFPEYEIFFTISTWLSFTAGLLFFVFPTTFTLWFGTHIIGISVLFLISAAKGIADWSLWAFVVPYWGWVVAVLIPGIGDLFKFYFRQTYLDAWVLLLFKIGFLIWAIVQFFALDL